MNIETIKANIINSIKNNKEEVGEVLEQLTAINDAGVFFHHDAVSGFIRHLSASISNNAALKNTLNLLNEEE